MFKLLALWKKQKFFKKGQMMRHKVNIFTFYLKFVFFLFFFLHNFYFVMSKYWLKYFNILYFTIFYLENFTFFKIILTLSQNADFVSQNFNFSSHNLTYHDFNFLSKNKIISDHTFWRFIKKFNFASHHLTFYCIILTFFVIISTLCQRYDFKSKNFNFFSHSLTF